MKRQTERRQRGICARCRQPREVDRVSPRILPPEGGLLCDECLTPATVEAMA